LLRIKHLITQLKAKKSRILQSDKEVKQEIEKHQNEAEEHEKQKYEIETKFKSYIHRMNEAATLMLRDFEENTKAKEICRLLEGMKNCEVFCNLLTLLFQT
jgi:tRNA U34 5-carboxymethylaminomethyl modifying enzyme MnmG/GidA